VSPLPPRIFVSLLGVAFADAPADVFAATAGDYTLEVFVAILSVLTVIALAGLGHLYRRYKQIGKLVRWLVGFDINGKTVNDGKVGELDDHIKEKADESRVEDLEHRLEDVEDEL